jgi:MFS family permease
MRSTGDGAIAAVVMPAVLADGWSRARLLCVLLAAQVCGSTGHSMAMAVGGIMAAEITGTNAWIGIPIAVGALGTALASWPLARLMARFGRRPGLALGYGLAVLGAQLGMVGALLKSFPLLLFGMALFGIANTSNLLARYAAADVSAGPERGRAMGLIVWGSAAGSIIGPNLMGLAASVGRPLGLTSASSAFLISVTGYGLATILIEALLRPDPLWIARRMEARATLSRVRDRTRSIREILSDPAVRIALATLTMSQLVMIGTTSTSPVYLRDSGHSVHTIGLAVSMHLGGMYISSPLSGWLSDRFGRLPIIGLGALVMVAAVALAGLVPGSERGLVILGLFLNGIGWNLAFVAGSALLTDALSSGERTSIQGMADLIMGLMGAIGSAVGGFVLGTWGFYPLNALGAACVVGPLIGVWLLRPRTLSPRQAG